MTLFVIIACSRCGGFLIADSKQKTRTCPYCGLKLSTSKARKLASAENAKEASFILRKLKQDALEKR